MDTHASQEEDKSYESGKESTLNPGSSYIRGHSPCGPESEQGEDGLNVEKSSISFLQTHLPGTLNQTPAHPEILNHRLDCQKPVSILTKDHCCQSPRHVPVLSMQTGFIAPNTMMAGAGRGDSEGHRGIK